MVVVKLKKTFGDTKRSSIKIASMSDKIGIGMTDFVEGYLTSDLFITYIRRLLNYHI